MTRVYANGLLVRTCVTSYGTETFALVWLSKDVTRARYALTTTIPANPLEYMVLKI